MAMDAFDLAERFQTPVFLMTDLDLGMNNWMADPFPYPEKPLDRGKVLRTKEEFEEHVAQVQGVRPLPGRRRRRHPLPDAARASSTTRPRAYFTPRLRPLRARHVHGEARGLQEQHGPPRAQVRDGPQVRAEAGRLERLGLACRRDRLRLVGLRRRGGAGAARAPGRRDRLPAPAGASLQRRRSPSSSPRTTASTSSTRTATDRCTTFCASSVRREASKLRSIRHYDGFPLDAETVVEGIEAGEKN